VSSVGERVRFATSDGLSLEGELAVAAEARVAMLLCHPHPQYGGTMRSLVTSELFRALPDLGVSCLRFNFRGVEGSEGEFDEGRGERLDVTAGIEELARQVGDIPLVVCGWSFGADVALSTPHPRVAGWIGVALPLRFATTDALALVAGDARPKHVILAEHDEFRDPDYVIDAIADWTATTYDVVSGASHFFVGRTNRVIEIASAFTTDL
jgi:alpha/beta superfamily hydrolase